MTLTPARFAAILLPVSLALSGCEEFQGLQSGTKNTNEASATLGPDEPRTVIREVERADIFSVTDTGLWDGRPSLGGVWVAHPDVADPERVKITNESNGKTVAGALFRRERANPGPRIQVSSDAASALGMLAGQPAELSIIVVRQEEIEIEPEPLPLSEETPEAEASGEVAAEPGAAEQAADGAEGAALAATGAAVATEAPRRKGFWARFRDSLRNKPSEEDAIGADMPEEATESAAVPDVETAPLDPVTSAAAAAIAEAESDASPAASGVSNPYIQVGLFSQEENASAAAASLRQAGIVPEIRGQSSGGKSLWRVFVGPVTSAEEQAALLKQIRQLGYTDAFAAPN